MNSRILITYCGNTIMLGNTINAKRMHESKHDLVAACAYMIDQRQQEQHLLNTVDGVRLFTK